MARKGEGRAARHIADRGRQRIITHGFEIETKAREVTLEKEVDITGKLNVIFTEDLQDA